MPWKETTSMSERVRFIADMLKGAESLSALCDRYGISRQCGYKWKARFEEGGLEALEPRSRAPLHHPNETPDDVVEVILDARRTHPSWGPRKVVAWLARTAPEVEVPCASTVGEILKRHGLVAPRRRRPRPSQFMGVLTPGSTPNGVWCTDFKGQFPVRSGRMCWPLTLTDLCSRYILRCQALTTSRTHQARPVFLAAFQEFGLPSVIRSDNGVPFSSRSPGGVSTLSAWWIKLGIRAERIEPAHPEQNGSHERMHKTLKAETTKPPQATISAQQRRFTAFREEFNNERPHEALAMATPASVYSASPRPYPRRIADPQYDADQVVRRLSKTGETQLKGFGIYCGRTVAHELVAFRQVAERRWEVRFYEHLLGHVILEGNTTLRPV